MKKGLQSIIFLLCTVTTTRLFAQDEIQKVQQEWGKDKKEITRLAMQLSPADSMKFWPVYDQYEAARQKIGRGRIILLDDYVTHYSSMTNAKADDLINRMFKNDQALAMLQQEYYGKFKTAVNSMLAAKFLQVESYLQSTIRTKLLESLPIIGELDKMKGQ